MLFEIVDTYSGIDSSQLSEQEHKKIEESLVLFFRGYKRGGCPDTKNSTKYYEMLDCHS